MQNKGLSNFHLSQIEYEKFWTLFNERNYTCKEFFLSYVGGFNVGNTLLLLLGNISFVNFGYLYFSCLMGLINLSGLSSHSARKVDLVSI